MIDITCTIKWRDKTYTVTYVPGDNCSGSGKTLPPVTHDTEHIVLGLGSADVNSGVTCEEEEGCTFSGWSKSTGGTVQPNATFNVTSDVTLTGQCSTNTYTVTYTQGNCASGGTSESGIAHGTSHKVLSGAEASIVAPQGGVFKRWEISGEPVNTTHVTVNGNITFVAVCEDLCPHEYPNADEGATNINQCYQEPYQTCNEPEDPSTPAGCESVEWKKCCPDQTLGKYKLYYDGTVVGEKFVTCSKTEIVADNVEPAEGHYYDPETGMCPEYNKLTYKCDVNGIIDVLSNKKPGDIVNIPENAPDCGESEYKFNRWECDSGTRVGDLLTMPDGDVVCTAQWDYYVSYYCDEEDIANGAEASLKYHDIAETNKKYTIETKGILSSGGNSCTNEGYEFDKWKCKVDNLAQEREAGSSINPWTYTDNMDCVVVWKEKEYTINYHVVMDGTWYSTEGGENSDKMDWPNDPENLKKYTKTIPARDMLLAKPTSKEGYVVEGDWYDCNDKTSVMYVPGSTLRANPKDIDLCINMRGWKIKYIGCKTGRVDQCTSQVDITNLIVNGTGGYEGARDYAVP